MSKRVNEAVDELRSLGGGGGGGACMHRYRRIFQVTADDIYRYGNASSPLRLALGNVAGHDATFVNGVQARARVLAHASASTCSWRVRRVMGAQ